MTIRIRRAILILCLAPLLVCPLHAMQRGFGWCQKGGQPVTTVGISSSNFFQQTFKSCTVTVYATGTLTLSTIYSDNSSTAKSNPFTADATGFWFFYAANGRYDVSLSGGATTISDLLLTDVGAGGAITSLNSLTATSQTFAVGTAGTDFAINSATSTHTFNIPTASASKRGLLASADWSTFNAKQAAISVSGAPLTFSSNVLGLSLPFTIAQGGTGQVTAAAGFAALSPLSTKGDLLSYSSAVGRFGVGTNGQILSADSTQTFGIKWITDAFSALTDPLTVAHGGTGLTAGTNGGVPCYTGATTVTSSALLAAGTPVIGGGSGACPTTNVATAYNGQTLAGNGLATTVFSTQVQTNQTSSHSTQVVLTAPTAGNYKVSYYLSTGSVSDGTATAQVTFNWTDGVGAKATTPLTALALASAANQTASYLVPIASGNLTYTATYSAGSGGNYNLLIVVERL